MTAFSRTVWNKPDRHRLAEVAYLSSLPKTARQITNLQAAVDQEQKFMLERLVSYARLTEKNRIHQSGRGDALTREEFKSWCEGEKLTSAFRKLYQAARC